MSLLVISWWIAWDHRIAWDPLLQYFFIPLKLKRATQRLSLDLRKENRSRLRLLVCQQDDKRREHRRYKELCEQLICEHDMPSASMEDRIGNHVDGGDVIDTDARDKMKRDTKFTKQETKPKGIISSMSKNMLFGFSAKTRNKKLFLGSPCDKIRSEKIQALVVDHRSLTKPTHSTSEKLRKVMG